MVGVVGTNIVRVARVVWGHPWLALGKESRMSRGGLRCVLGSVVMMVAGFAAGCASSGGVPRGEDVARDTHELDGGVHVVSEAPPDCPVCALYETSSASVVRVVRAGSHGAGVVIDEAGRIVTNAHVVGTRDEILVETSSRTMVRGDVVARESAIDLALIETNSPDVRWTPIAYDTEETVRIGSDVYVIGHPVGLGWTVTRGILSARRAPSSERPGGLIQTDAAVSPGNSGGALLDGHGHLIGIVHSKVSEPNAENVAFAIPLDAVLTFIDSAGDSVPGPAR